MLRKKAAPRGELSPAHRRPQWDWTMDLQTASPIPTPCGLVVKKASKIWSAFPAGRPMPVVPAIVRRVVVLGDTGCRIQNRTVQDCNNPAAWPFRIIAERAAARRPDLVIHVGDYYYRESACLAGHAACAGSGPASCGCC